MSTPANRRAAATVVATLVAAAVATVWLGSILLDKPLTGGGRATEGPIDRPETPRGAASKREPEDAASGRAASEAVLPATASGTARPVVFAFAGTVRNVDEAPVEGAEVELAYDLSGSGAPGLVGEADPRAAATRTDAAGAFVFEGLDGAQRYVCRVRHPDYAAAEIRGVEASRPTTVVRDVLLLAGAAIEGRVTSEGRPVAGARVRVVDLKRPATDLVGYVEREATTDAAGRFVAGGLVAGGKAVRVDAAGLVAARIGPLRAVVGAPPLALDVALAPGKPLRGRVLRRTADDGLEVVAGARVVAQLLGPADDAPPPPTNLPFLVTTTDGGGGFLFESLPDAQFLVHVQAPGDADAIVTPAPPPGEEAKPGPPTVRPGGSTVDFVLARLTTGVILGRAFDLETGSGLPRFFVWTAEFDDPFATPGRRKFVEHPAGLFELEGVPPGDWYVFVEPLGAPPTGAGPFRVEVGRRTTGAEIGATPGVIVSGRLIDDRGRPFAGATLAVRSPKKPETPTGRGASFVDPRKRTGAAPGRAVSAEDGTFELRTARGSWRLVVAHPAAVEHTTDPYACFADVATGDLVLRRAGRLAGVVRLADGEPDPNAVVEARADGVEDRLAVRTGRTGADGRYEIASLEPGAYWIRLGVRDRAPTIGRPDGVPALVRIEAGEVLVRDF